MISLERLLFDLNEAFYNIEFIPPDRYITFQVILFALLVVTVAIPLNIKLVEYIDSLELKYIPLIIIAISFLILYILGGYLPILIVLCLIGFYLIIATYPQYRDIKDFIERLF